MAMENRYALLLKPGATYDEPDDDDDDNHDYATFLVEKERKCTRDFFVDSKKYQGQFAPQQENKSNDSSTKSEKKRKTPSVLDLVEKRKHDQRDHERRLKVIEDHMWQHKQEERELKRFEGDIIKNQREVRRSLRDYENAITRKKLAEEKKINQTQQKYADTKQQYLHKQEEQSKQRLDARLSSEQNQKDMGRKVLLTTSDLARQYRSKMAEADLKRIEVQRLSKDFESRIRAKEEEQFRLKQELADLAISLNMEAMKGRTQDAQLERQRKKEKQAQLDEKAQTQDELETKLFRSETDAKTAEQGRRKLSADLTLTRAHLHVQMREDQRHRKDTDNRLREKHNIQKQLNDAQQHAEMDRQNKIINQKVDEHNQRRHLLASQYLNNKKQQSVQQEQQGTQKAHKRFIEQQRREHEDHLKHFQKEVAKGEDVEYTLYNKVKNSEYKRQQKEQQLRRIQNELEEIKRENAMTLKKQAIEAAHKEEELKQTLIREKAALAKVHAEREESYTTLQIHRQQLRQDKYLLQEHEREHQRLLRVGARTEQASYA